MSQLSGLTVVTSNSENRTFKSLVIKYENERKDRVVSIHVLDRDALSLDSIQ